MKIVWLEPPNLSANFRKVAQNYLRNKALPVESTQFTCLTEGCLRKVNRTKWEADPEQADEFKTNFLKLKPDFVIVNDKAALNYITGKYTSLALCRGGIYNYCGVPCLVVNELRQTKITNIGGWVMLQDLGKAHRWLTGTIRNEPRFEYTVCHSVNEVQALVDVASRSLAIAVDIETVATSVSSVQYTCLWQLASGKYKMHTWNVPIINPTKKGGCHWDSEEEEIAVWNYIAKINATPAYKVFQNGSYDSTYFTVYRIPLHNLLCDTLHAMHSIWIESPKRLDFISSIAIDSYQYWKDEGKVEDKKDDQNKTRIPKDLAGLQDYWRYGALDTHNTMLDFRFLLAVMQKRGLEWTLDNYKREMRQQYGPAFAMSMRGIKCNKDLHMQLILELGEQSAAALAELHIATAEPTFNPNSPIQVKKLIYECLKAEPYGRGKQRGSTDEKILKMIQDQHPMLRYFIDLLWAVKKPANNASKYGHGCILNDRFMYKMSVAATETGRYGSKANDLWVGTNIQNLPYVMRIMLEADEDWVLFDIDYAQSDAYFTAFESGDEKFIATMLGDEDTHCKHCEFFFQIPYDKLIASHKEKADWVSHNVTGVRSITKRIVYGANYLMKGPTLLLTMSRAPLRAAGKMLGYPHTERWKDKQLTKLADAFLKKYFIMYPRILPWLEEALARAKGLGNRATCAFGMTRIFFGSLDDNAIQRTFASFFGQGGTAGNINKALDRIFYDEREFDGNVMLLFQVHDSIVGQVRKSHLHLIPEIQRCMANECTLNGRTFTVPTEADVGLGWGKRMMPYHDGITYEEIEANDKKWWGKRNGKKR